MWQPSRTASYFLQVWMHFRYIVSLGTYNDNNNWTEMIKCTIGPCSAPPDWLWMIYLYATTNGLSPPMSDWDRDIVTSSPQHLHNALWSITALSPCHGCMGLWHPQCCHGLSGCHFRCILCVLEWCIYPLSVMIMEAGPLGWMRHWPTKFTLPSASSMPPYMLPVWGGGGTPSQFPLP